MSSVLDKTKSVPSESKKVTLSNILKGGAKTKSSQQPSSLDTEPEIERLPKTVVRESKKTKEKEASKDIQRIIRPKQDIQNKPELLREREASNDIQRIIRPKQDIQDKPELLREREVSEDIQRIIRPKQDIQNKPELLKEREVSEDIQRIIRPKQDIQDKPELLKEKETSQDIERIIRSKQDKPELLREREVSEDIERIIVPESSKRSQSKEKLLERSKTTEIEKLKPLELETEPVGSLKEIETESEQFLKSRDTDFSEPKVAGPTKIASQNILSKIITNIKESKDQSRLEDVEKSFVQNGGQVKSDVGFQNLTLDSGKSLGQSILGDLRTSMSKIIEEEKGPTAASVIMIGLKEVPKYTVINIMDCPPCNAPIPMVDRKTFILEQKFYEIFTDNQLNHIGLDRNIPDVVIYPHARKIQMLLSDPNRNLYPLRKTLDELSVGDLLYLAAKENIPVYRIPDRYNVRRILVSLILYQRKRSDLIQHCMLSDDDLRTIVYVIQTCKDIDYSWILERKDLESVIDTGIFPQCNDKFLIRWRRYEILKILPQPFLQGLSFQIPSSNLEMTPSDGYIISRLIDIPINPFEAIYAKDRNVNIELLKLKYGIVVPKIWNVLDYLALNGKDYPLDVPSECFSVEKLLSIGTREGQMEYISKYNDATLFNEIKIYVPYNSRVELIENILTLFDTTQNIYFVSLLPQLQGKIYYGNYSYSEVYSPETLATKIEFLTTQNYPIEDKLLVIKKTRQLQTLLQARDMMTPLLAAVISRMITTYEGNVDGQPIYYYFLQLSDSDVANIRKMLYQKLYFSQTRNCLYLPSIDSIFQKLLPKLCDVNQSVPKCHGKINDLTYDLFETIAYMKLFFGQVPHSIRNL